MGIGKYRNNQNWNIGFCRISPSDLVREKCLPIVHWLNHDFKDRYFADPFILRADGETIWVLAEEMEFSSKGVISLLVVDAATYVLLERKVLLDLDTHLSYPAIYRDNGKVYIYPENYSAGQLNLYELDIGNFSLKHVSRLCDLALTDATVWHASDGKFYMLSTLASDSRNNAFLFVGDDIRGVFTRVSVLPVTSGQDRSRCGGNFFEADGRLFRPAQNCSRRYGGALKVMEVLECVGGRYSERESFELAPHSWKYNLGMHTLNFSPEGSLAVIDGYGYLYPFVGRMLDAASRIYHMLRGDGVSLS